MYLLVVFSLFSHAKNRADIRSVCLYVLSTRMRSAKTAEPNGDAVWRADSVGPKEPRVGWGWRFLPREEAIFGVV